MGFQIYIKFPKNLVKCYKNVGATSAVHEKNLMFWPLFFVQSKFFASSSPRFDVSLVRWTESQAKSLKKIGSTRSRCDAGTLLLSYVILRFQCFVDHLVSLLKL